MNKEQKTSDWSKSQGRIHGHTRLNEDAVLPNNTTVSTKPLHPAPYHLG